MIGETAASFQVGGKQPALARVRCHAPDAHAAFSISSPTLTFLKASLARNRSKSDDHCCKPRPIGSSSPQHPTQLRVKHVKLRVAHGSDWLLLAVNRVGDCAAPAAA
jgi:hypothetical protein